MAYIAKFDSTCRACGGPIRKGQDEITWSRRHRGKYVHKNCIEADVPGGTSTPDMPNSEVQPEADSATTAGAALEALAEALKGRIIPAATPAIDLAQIERMINEALDKREPFVVTIASDGNEPVVVEGAHKNFPALAYMVSTGRPVFLYGPHGSGKSHAARQLADAMGSQYGYISMTKQTPMSALFGYMDAHGKYVVTEYRKCYEYGGVFCIDEADNGSANLLASLNAALENGQCAFPDAIVKKHPNFRLIGTGNTSGRGPNPAYPERAPFDSAFGDRFNYLAWEYDTALERSIALAINPNAGPWVEWVIRLREWCKTSNPRLAPSPRASFKLAEFLRDGNLTMDIALDAAVWHGAADDARAKALANVPYPAAWASKGESK